MHRAPRCANAALGGCPAPQHYPTLLRQVSALVLTDDRAAITTALRILVRLSGTLDNDYAMASLDLAVLARLIPLVLLDDEPFVHAVLEFLSRYTAIGPETAARVGMAGQPGVVSTLIAIMASGYRGTHSLKTRACGPLALEGLRAGPRPRWAACGSQAALGCVRASCAWVPGRAELIFLVCAVRGTTKQTNRVAVATCTAVAARREGDGFHVGCGVARCVRQPCAGSQNSSGDRGGIGRWPRAPADAVVGRLARDACACVHHLDPG